MSENIMGFSKATKAIDDIPSLTLIFDTEAPYPHDYKAEAYRIAQYMYMSLPSLTIKHLAEYLTEQAKELQ